jgi:hypothetical protein
MLSDPTKSYLQQLASLAQPEAGSDIPRIHVDQVASRIATLYEKLRQVIDYQEEHLLKKNAIERVLKRRLLLSSSPEEIAQPLISELIRGGYFPNDKIPETKIPEIEKILEKYIFLTQNLPSEVTNGEKRQIADWTWSLASSEIEERLTPKLKEETILVYMFEELRKRIVFQDSAIDENLKRDLIFIACQKALLKSDPSLISWRLLKLLFPIFPVLPLSRDFFISFSQQLPAVKSRIESEINHVLAKKVLEKVYAFSPIFLMVQDITLANSPAEVKTIFENPETLETRIKTAYDSRYKTLQKQNRTWGFRWVLSIILSKMLIAFLIEVPYDRLNHNFSSLALAVNLFVPPFVMFLIISSIRAPGQDNKNRVLIEAMKIIYPQNDPETVIIKKIGEKNLADLFARISFFVVSAVVFALVVWILVRIHFSWLSILVFIAFFSLIAFSGLKIEASSKQLRVKSSDEGITSFIGDLFFLPFRNVGKWLSVQLQKYNLLILVLNLFFEAPLQVFFEFLESWRNYLKEKKQDME